ncbi:hypothetical protein A5844_001895 [Enterococcus sp. 10A9_DIV0425]|uniref:Uncharacterized protein n=2 Tax=Candidatus Enterococcus wittei TaxID=1987383 RepID=A0A242JXZ9_9ENTE|nr:hypothetical protein A5844_001895 [Enterococcus sp. 10A9_DIV0425]
MKKLTKIKLINWHMFKNQTIQIKDNVLMSGDNKSGKSTVLDAIQFILTAGKAKFNMAANERSTRTLEGYVRGKLGVEGKKFLREDFVVAHVALEFQTGSDMTSYFVLGAVIEAEKHQQPRAHFYKINSALQEEWFVDNKNVRDMVAFRAYFKNQQIQIDIPSRATQKNIMFTTALGVKSKYMELVPKALAFKPVEDLNKFIFQFLLDDEPVDIDTLRENIRSYRSINQKLVEEEKSLNELTQIRNCYYEIEEGNRQLNIANRMEELLKEKFLIKKQSKNIEEITKKKRQLKQIDEQLPIKEQYLKENQEKKFQLEHDHDLQVIRDTERELDRLRLEVEQRETGYKKYLSLLKEANLYLKPVNLLLDVKLLTSKESAQEKRIGHLEEFSKGLHKVKEQYRKELFQFESRMNDLNLKIKESTNLIRSLEKRQFKYPDETKKLQEILTRELKNFYEEPIEVKPLCELLEMHDESWRNAAEGFLGKNRFNLIVEPKYFLKAMEFYKEYTQKEKIFGVRVVDVSKTKEFSAEEGTLAKQLQCKNQFAQGYINFLLGRVKCVDEVVCLRNHKVAITKECMTYNQYSVYAIHPKVYNKPYIGQQAFETQLKNERKVLIALREEKQRIESQRTETNRLFSSLERIKPTELKRLDEQLENYWISLESKASLEDFLSTFKEKDELFSKIEALENLKSVVHSYELDVNELKEQKGGYKKEIEQSERDLASVNEQLKLFSKVKETCSIQDIDTFEKAQLELKKVLAENKNALNETSKIIQAKQLKIRRDNEDKVVWLKDSMIKFNNRTKLGYGNSLDNIQQYLDKFNQLNEIDIIRTKDSLNLAKEKSEKAFNESFVAKLSDNINKAKKSIKELNKGLEQQSFNGDTYKFVYEANSDPAFKQYYEIVTGNNALYMDNLFLDGLMDHERDLMETLFDKLAYFDDERKDERELRKYTDYRNYMSYDIIVTNENGDITKLSNVIKENSGGETQTPFYVTIASCFEQMLHKLNIVEAGCVVLFDEAFNNMDEARIKAMMKFYNNLNIQIIIVVPPNRLSTILPYVQTTVGVIRKGNQSFAVELCHEKDS